MRLVGATTGVDYALIRQWKMQPWWSDLEKEIRATQNIEMDTKLSKIVEKSMAVTMDRLENGEMVLNNKTGELVRKPVAMRDAAKVATDFMQRQQVIRKDESETTQVSQVSVTEQLKTLAMEFAKWQSKAQAKAEALDVEFKEIEGDSDAVYEEREEGLQTGSEGVYLETGSEEEEGGAECSPPGTDERGPSQEG